MQTIERLARNCQAYHPEPSGTGLCCAHCLVSHHQGVEGAPSRQEEGEEHQAQQVCGPRRDHRDRTHYAPQVVLEGSEGYRQGDAGHRLQCRLPR